MYIDAELVVATSPSACGSMVSTIYLYVIWAVAARGDRPNNVQNKIKYRCEQAHSRIMREVL
jgi:hypothetical protein